MVYLLRLTKKKRKELINEFELNKFLFFKNWLMAHFIVFQSNKNAVDIIVVFFSCLQVRKHVSNNNFFIYIKNICFLSFKLFMLKIAMRLMSSDQR